MAELEGRKPFDKETGYVAQEEQGWFDDGREIALLHFIFDHPNLEAARGNPAEVLKLIDEYGRTKKYLMNVGRHKGKIVTDLIAEIKPSVMVELGGYVAYSGILFADAVRKAGGKRYISLERSPEFAAIIMCLADLAGLSEFLKVYVGASDQSLKRLHSEGIIDHIDLMFLDHWKPAYTTDLKLCEELGLVKVGSVMAADNVIKPGNPPYLEYVRSTVEQKREAFNKEIETGPDLRFPQRTAQQYKSRMGDEKISTSVKGNPNLVYESKLMKSWEPTGVPDGVEVTRCVGEEKDPSPAAPTHQFRSFAERGHGPVSHTGKVSHASGGDLSGLQK